MGRSSFHLAECCWSPLCTLCPLEDQYWAVVPRLAVRWGWGFQWLQGPSHGEKWEGLQMKGRREIHVRVRISLMYMYLCTIGPMHNTLTGSFHTSCMYNALIGPFPSVSVFTTDTKSRKKTLDWHSNYHTIDYYLYNVTVTGYNRQTEKQFRSVDKSYKSQEHYNACPF